MTATDLGQIPMSPDLGTTLSRGAEFAAAAGASDVTLEHLLAALCDDRDAIAVLDASNINGAALKADVVAQFPRSDTPSEETPVSLGVSQDVRRILEAAAAAARGSRRRDINGAIVLAAIVGDARSAAAEMLQAHGLTFDGAIRALQAALAPPRASSAPPPVADDVLARARERVQSRSAPSLRDIMNEMPRTAPPPSVAIPDAAKTIQPSSEERSMAGAPDPSAGADQSSTIVSPPSPSEAPSHQEEPEQPRPQEPVAYAAPEPRPEKRPEPSFPRTEKDFTPAKAPDAPAAPAGRPGSVSRPSQDHPSGPSLPFPGQPEAQPRPSGSQGASQGAGMPFPEHPGAGAAGSASIAGAPQRPFPGDLPRPRPSGAMPPPIPAPGGMRPLGGQPGAPASMPVPGSIAPPGPLHSEPSFGPPPPGEPPPNGPPLQPRGSGKVRAPSRKRAKSPKTETGQLAENIPRAMRVGRTERVEVRIAKASVKALTDGLEGDGAVWQHKVTITKAMAVRIRAPDGGFFIETASPETQWIENTLGYASDDFASWRFLITPQSRGWSQLQIIISARTIGTDGVAAETALPDQVIEVKVKRNLKRTFARIFSWTVAAIVGGALSTFGEGGVAAVKTILQRLVH
ncbi:Clp protease N-terminal domain-containing protein [Hyphomicrobium sp.]|uniref:Clp protease N-terminal domain-containing protein n=1 Tax=Hyphomicrobium sp. TaxID=82 RepID=UPI002D17FA37|nr:Clp protease N-terminal domain-containing protein [Hyphomicrobium sp.]HVZ05624.1 Clp protease N-terminal domain-containing protein [Hyphomicrobium sp.]